MILTVAYHKHSLNRHIESVHEEKKLFNSSDAGISTKHDLNGHVEAVYEGNKHLKSIYLMHTLFEE